MKRRIAVVTGTRAEYGLLYWLLRCLEEDAAVDLQVMVTGAHLSARFGSTVRQIEADGFPIASRVPVDLDDDSVLGITRALSTATLGFGQALAEVRPDLLVLLGDRYEILAAAQAALIARIPVAHLHGGESTEGVIDEAIRHTITKMAHLHFVAAEAYRQRVIQLGESPERVWNVGATGLDNIERLKLLGREQLEDALGVVLRRPFFIVTYHPVTLSAQDQGAAMRTLLHVIEEFGGTIVITGVNADTGSDAIRAEATSFAQGRPGSVVLVESLGSLKYLSALAEADAVVGNSSSGLIEAPALGTPTVNVGDRQRGRLQAPSVIQSSEDADSLRAALQQALSEGHKTLSARRETPYGKPGAARRIAGLLSSFPLDGLIIKRFHDVHGVVQ